MTKVCELFGKSTSNQDTDWAQLINEKLCPYDQKVCFKTKKNDTDFSIGTCTVLASDKPAMICPKRLLENDTVFYNCINRFFNTELNDMRIEVVSELKIPGGHVDFIVTQNDELGNIIDFVGVEFQTLDTTGAVLPQREKFLKSQNVTYDEIEANSKKKYGINWKMTAKTILVQMAHKIETFDYLDKKLVLVIQDILLDYMQREFNFNHFNYPAIPEDSFHIHSYRMVENEENELILTLDKTISTDVNGVNLALLMLGEAIVELDDFINGVKKKKSSSGSRQLL